MVISVRRGWIGVSSRAWTADQDADWLRLDLSLQVGGDVQFVR